MNLQKLFEMQRRLDEHIEKKHPRQEGEDRLAKKILALMVELGELANEWRGFKFWSYCQTPRTEELGECPLCKGTGDLGTVWAENCIECGGTGKVVIKNPLLEEYVDGLHFYLSIGNELGIELGSSLTPSKVHDVLTLFALVNRYVAELWWCCHDGDDAAIAKYVFGFEHYLRLGETLGFTWEQIEEEYCKKNQINHERQDNGY